MERNNLELLRKPTLTMIKTIIQSAIQSPSGDNAQPWRFHWDGEKLEVLYSKEAGRHVLNRQERVSILTLGTVIESIKIAASQFSLVAMPKLVLSNESDLSVWAEVRFSFASIYPDRLVPMIARRATDRRPFHGGQFDEDLLQKIQEIESEFPGYRIHIQTKPGRTFMNYYLKAEGLFWQNKNVVRDLSKWLRLTKKEVSRSNDGMSAKNAGMNPVEALSFRLFRIFPILPKILWHLGFGGAVKAKMKKGVQSSAGLICITAPTSGYESLYKVGQIGYRVWLLLNANRFGVQPLSYCSFSVADFQAGVFDQDQDAAEFKLFKHGQDVLKETFQLADQETPVWVFRTGLSSELPKDTRAPKKNVEEVIV